MFMRISQGRELPARQPAGEPGRAGRELQSTAGCRDEQSNEGLTQPGWRQCPPLETREGTEIWVRTADKVRARGRAGVMQAQTFAHQRSLLRTPWGCVVGPALIPLPTLACQLCFSPKGCQAFPSARREHPEPVPTAVSLRVQST